MTRIEISAVTGGSYPINVYVSDYYGNYETLIYTITSGNTIPPATGATLSSTFAKVFISSITEDIAVLKLCLL